MVMQLEDITYDMFSFIKIYRVYSPPLHPDFSFCTLRTAMIYYKHKNIKNFFRTYADINSILKNPCIRLLVVCVWINKK